MKLSAGDLLELADVAIAAATEAGEMISTSRPRDVEHKPSAQSLASQVVTEIDRRAERIIVEHLAPTLERCGLALLTEETDDDGGRLVADHFWCVDPLDGTLPFIEEQPGHSVSIALVARDGTPLIGVVCDPVEATLFHAIRGGGAFRDGGPWHRPPTGPSLSVFADRSFAETADHDSVVDALERIARETGLDGIRFHPPAGAVMNAIGVLAHPPACYVKYPAPTSGGSLWDFAATACLFHEVGAVATDIGGDPLDLNRPDSVAMNHRGVLCTTDEALAARIRAIRR